MAAVSSMVAIDRDHSVNFSRIVSGRLAGGVE
jgi:hypothetical protein